MDCRIAPPPISQPSTIVQKNGSLLRQQAAVGTAYF
jgi:hypothetical protein